MNSYYDPQDLAKFPEIGEEAPEVAKKFFDYYQAVFAEGELTEREKALIALAAACQVAPLDSPSIEADSRLRLGVERIGEAVNEATHVLLDVAAMTTPFHDSRTKLGPEPDSLDRDELFFSHADQALKKARF